MSPSAGPATPTVAADAGAPAGILQDGEAIILAIKPSRWFVLLTSLPVLVVSALVAGAAYVLDRVFHVGCPREAAYLVCSVAAGVRVILACFQWQGRLYLLTNLRVMRISGVMRRDIFSCRLRKLRRAAASATIAERVLGIGSLFFQPADPDARGPGPQGTWINVPRPAEVEHIVNEAIRRSGRR